MPLHSSSFCKEDRARTTERPIGRPSVPMAGWPVYSEEEIEAVGRVLRSGQVNYWTGEECLAFEREYAASCSTRFAISCANGTLALQAALVGVGIRPGDEVVVTPRSFIASAACVVLAGAVPAFADVDPTSGNLSPDAVERVLTERTRAIIAVHLGGWPCDMDRLLAIAHGHGLAIIEDCAQAHGATDKGRPVGSLGTVGAFSFCQDKIISTGGEGGMLVTNDEAVWRRAWSWKDHGKGWDAVHTGEPSPIFRWVHESIGTNARLSEMQAAIGRIHLRKLPQWLQRRRENASAWTAALGNCDLFHIPRPERCFGHAYYRFYVQVRLEKLRRGWSRDRLCCEIRARGVPCSTGSCSEIYREKAFKALPGCPTEGLPNARRLGETSLMLLAHPTLAPADVQRAAAIVAAVAGEATA